MEFIPKYVFETTCNRYFEYLYSSAYKKHKEN